jgi:hypothetical protein
MSNKDQHKKTNCYEMKNEIISNNEYENELKKQILAKKNMILNLQHKKKILKNIMNKK